MIVKVCGMRDAQNIRAVEALGVDYMGFVFYPHSPRYVDRVPAYLPSKAVRAGVFVDATIEEILRRTELFSLGVVQLHGAESPAFCLSLRKKLPPGTKIVKAVAVAGSRDMDRTADYRNVCAGLLFETPSMVYGGSGRRFDWSLTERYRGPLPFILSGGIGPESLAALTALRHPYWAGVDLNSCFETAPGMKDAALLEKFLKTLKNSL